jgi:hypothetical protein
MSSFVPTALTRSPVTAIASIMEKRLSTVTIRPWCRINEGAAIAPAAESKSEVKIRAAKLKVDGLREGIRV